MTYNVRCSAIPAMLETQAVCSNRVRPQQILIGRRPAKACRGGRVYGVMLTRRFMSSVISARSGVVVDADLVDQALEGRRFNPPEVQTYS
jgi:hypothetical protein